MRRRVPARGAQVPPLGVRRLHEEDVRVARVLHVRQWDAPEPGVHRGQHRVELRVTCGRRRAGVASGKIRQSVKNSATCDSVTVMDRTTCVGFPYL